LAIAYVVSNRMLKLFGPYLGLNGALFSGQGQINPALRLIADLRVQLRGEVDL